LAAPRQAKVSAPRPASRDLANPRLDGPLLARIAELEQRVAELEDGIRTAQRRAAERWLNEPRWLRVLHAASALLGGLRTSRA
jgi:hypothetical protein